MKEQEIKELKKLYKAYIKAKNAHYSKLNLFISELGSVCNKEINYNEFSGDGLGVSTGYSNDTYMHITDAIALIKEKGTIDENDFTYL